MRENRISVEARSWEEGNIYTPGQYPFNGFLCSETDFQTELIRSTDVKRSSTGEFLPRSFIFHLKEYPLENLGTDAELKYIRPTDKELNVKWMPGNDESV